MLVELRNGEEGLDGGHYYNVIIDYLYGVQYIYNNAIMMIKKKSNKVLN